MADLQIAGIHVNWLSILLLVLPSIYLVTIWRVFFGWKNLKNYTNNHEPHLPQLSVIIAARNEEENLPSLLNRLNNQDYPKNLFEVIIVDDHSAAPLTHTLNTKKYTNLNLRICSLESSKQGKKDALMAGAEISKNELLLFTDADCLPGFSWISTMAAYYQKEKPALLIGLVDYLPTNSLLQKLFRLEFLSMVITGAGTAGNGNPTLCNGANLAVRRDTFLKHAHSLKKGILSGDDIFLLQAVKSEVANKICVVKNPKAILYTAAPLNLSQFLHQRQRWASKTRFYTDAYTLYLAFLVLLTSLSIVVSLVLGISQALTLEIALLPLILKTIADYPLLAAGLKFFGNHKTLRWVTILELIYPFYILTSAFQSQFQGFIWKRREQAAFTTQPQQSSW